MTSLNKSEYTNDADISGNDYNTEQYNKDILPFWSENPNVLFDPKYITEFFPVESFTYNQKLNAISRTVIILILLSYFYSSKIRVLIIGIISLLAIFVMHYYHKKGIKDENKDDLKEGFENPALEVLKKYNVDSTTTFDKPSESNPFSNVMIPDYDYNPHKKPAPPAFNDKINLSIIEQAKKLVIDQNPGQPNIADKLFKDLGEQFEFEQSLQPFYSNAATTIPNDQAGFADFCYGSMVSCKEGNLFACARNLDRYTN